MPDSLSLVRFVALLLGTLSVLPACNRDQEPELPEPLCSIPTPQNTLGQDRPLRPQEWFTLLLGEGTEEGQLAPESDCTGGRIRWPIHQTLCEWEPDLYTPRQAVLNDESIVTSTVNSRLQLVWVITHRWNNRDGLGVVALVETIPREDEDEPGMTVVRSIGVLKNRTFRPYLRIDGRDDSVILIAEGERCLDYEDLTTCERMARIIPLDGDRFMPTAVRLPNRECIGESVIHVNRDYTVTFDDGWQRTFSEATNFNYDHGVINIEEQVIADDFDPGHSEVPQRRFRKSDARRSITVYNGDLIAQGNPLWDRMLYLYATTRFTEIESRTELGHELDRDVRELHLDDAVRQARGLPERPGKRPPGDAMGGTH